MIKKEYQNPTVNVVKIKTQDHILTVSNVKATGLDDELYRGEDGDMEEGAMSRRRYRNRNVWEDEEVLEDEEVEDW